jgi:hypothetical protein
LQDTVVVTTKPKQITFEKYPGLADQIWFIGTPYEPLIDGNYSQREFGPRDGYYYTDQDTWVTGETVRSFMPVSSPENAFVTPDDPQQIVRWDMRWLSSSAQGNGWEHQFEIRGNRALFNTIVAGREIQLCVREFVDDAPTGEGYTQRKCINGGTFIRCYIKDIGGITTTLMTGEEKLTVTATTPEPFLDKLWLPRMVYLLKQTVDLERSATLALPRTELALGFAPTGTGPFTSDPFSGFGNYFDEFTTDYNTTMTVQPANERHFLTSLSVMYAFEEVINNHVFFNSGGSFHTLGSKFNCEIVPDAEQYLVDIQHGPGSPHQMALESLRHGNYRYWWDCYSNMHIIPDYCNPMTYSTIDWPEILISRNYIGEFSATPGPPDDYPRVNRAAVEGQWSTANRGPLGNGGAVPPLNYSQTGPNKAVYPFGQHVGQGGDEITFTGYQGINVVAIAQSEFNRANQKTTITLSNIPWVSWALNAWNRLVKVTAIDPMGSYNFNNKYFSASTRCKSSGVIAGLCRIARSL